MPHYETTLTFAINAYDEADARHLTDLHVDRLRSVSAVIVDGKVDSVVLNVDGIHAV